MRLPIALALASLMSCPVMADSVFIRCGAVWDGVKAGGLAGPTLIEVNDGHIVSLTRGGTAPNGAKVTDLSALTCLPGLIDTHTHVLLQGDITADD